MPWCRCSSASGMLKDESLCSTWPTRGNETPHTSQGLHLPAHWHPAPRAGLDLGITMTLTEPPARPPHPRSSHEGMGPMAPRPEAVAAAAWWAEQLATPPRHDVGAPLRTALANV